MPEIITRADALSKGLKRYFDGLACKRGHIVEKQTSNGTCIQCHNDRRRRENMTPEQIEMSRAHGRIENMTPQQLEKKRSRNRAFMQLTYYPANRDAILSYQDRYYAEHRLNPDWREHTNALKRQRDDTPQRRATNAAKQADRNARKKGCTPRWAAPEFAKEERQAIAKVCRKRAKGEHIDHYEPLVGRFYRGSDPDWQGVQIAVGLHVSWNLVPQPDAVNLSKGARPPAPNVFDWTTPIEAQEARAAESWEWWPGEWWAEHTDAYD